MTKLNDYFNLGNERLGGASPFRVGNLRRYIYRAEETDLDYLVTGKDIIELGRMLSRNVPDAYSHWCAGCGHELTSLNGWTVGDRVEAGDNFDDYDVGKIMGVRRNLDHSENGAEVEVAWDSGVTTWQLGAGLRKEGTRPYLENEDE